MNTDSKPFKWKKITLGEQFAPFANKYHYIVSDRYRSAFGFEIEEIGAVNVTITPLAYTHFSSLPHSRRKRITAEENGKLKLSQVPDYTQEKYNADENLFPVYINIQSKKIGHIPITIDGLFYDFPLKCILRIGELEFFSEGEQVVTTMKFDKWSASHEDPFFLYLPSDSSLLKKIRLSFRKSGN